MNPLRFSLLSLMLGVANLLWLIGGLSALGMRESAITAAHGGLHLTTLGFSLLCGLFGRTAGQNLLLSGTFYAWGMACLYLGDAFEIRNSIRSLLAAVGVAYVVVGWLWSGGGGRVAVAERSVAQRRHGLADGPALAATKRGEPQRTQRTQSFMQGDHEGHEVHEGMKCDGLN
jgi:hypothetical protein